MFPLLAIVSISLRPGNFATGSLIPEQISFEHWQLALGIPYTMRRRQRRRSRRSRCCGGCGTRSRSPASRRS
ncbi:MAG: hypothetical protein MZW92_66445 [Comamonadaceae bacterium]|nr:hypothetical protein [Comamonadaceae bacterium]